MAAGARGHGRSRARRGSRVKGVGIQEPMDPRAEARLVRAASMAMTNRHPRGMRVLAHTGNVQSTRVHTHTHTHTHTHKHTGIPVHTGDMHTTRVHIHMYTRNIQHTHNIHTHTKAYRTHRVCIYYALSLSHVHTHNIHTHVHTHNIHTHTQRHTSTHSISGR